MKYSELSQKSEAELRKELMTLQEKRENLKMKIKLGQIKNVKELAGIKKNIARLLTYFRAN